MPVDGPGGGPERSLRALAPEWLVRVLQPQPGPIAWSRALRAVAAITAPVAVGMAVGAVSTGLFISLGALSGTNADRGGPARVRALRIGSAVAAGTLGLLLGSATRGHGWSVVGFEVAVAVVSALVSTVGNVASVAALQLLVFSLVAAGRSLAPPLWLPPLLFLSGGG